MPKGQTVTILPETGGDILCVRFMGTVDAEDYRTYFDAPLAKIALTYGHVNVLIHFDDSFSGWTPEAADLSFINIATYVPKAKKIAYINAPDSRMLMVKMLDPIMQGETRFFEGAEIQHALQWIKT